MHDPNQILLSLLAAVADMSPGSGPLQDAADRAYAYLDTQAKIMAGDFATLTYQLEASTGYSCEGTVSAITPQHWGRIVAAHNNQVAFADRLEIRQEALRFLKRDWLGDDHERLGAGVAGTAAMKFARTIQIDQDLRVFVDQWGHAPEATLRTLFPRIPVAALNYAMCPASRDGDHSEAWWDGEGCHLCGAPSMMRLEMARLGMEPVDEKALAEVMVEASPGIDMGTAEYMAKAAMKWLLARPEVKNHG